MPTDAAKQRWYHLTWLTWVALALVFGAFVFRFLLGVQHYSYGSVAYGWPRPMVLRRVDLGPREITRWTPYPVRIVKVFAIGIAADIPILLFAVMGTGLAMERWCRKYQPKMNLRSMLTLTGFAATACAFARYTDLRWEIAATQFCETVILISICAAWFMVIELASFCYDWFTGVRTAPEWVTRFETGSDAPAENKPAGSD